MAEGRLEKADSPSQAEGSTTNKTEDVDFESSPDAYHVRLDAFEGPLDLLLHLIRKYEVDIYDIPIALITQQYLDYIELMQELNLDVAGEFLVCGTLPHHPKPTHIPLLPDPPPPLTDPPPPLKSVSP